MPEEYTHHPTMISSDIEFRGEVKCEHELEIHGFIEGTIETKGVVQIQTNAVAKTDIKAGHVDVKGLLQGNIYDTRFVHLYSTGKVKGDIQSKEIQVDRKGSLQGVVLV